MFWSSAVAERNTLSPSDPLGFTPTDLLVYVGRICHFLLRHCGWKTTSSPDHCLNVLFPAVADGRSVLTSTFLPIRLVLIGCFLVLHRNCYDFFFLHCGWKTTFSLDYGSKFRTPFIVFVEPASLGLPPLRLREVFSFRPFESFYLRRCGRSHPL